MMTRPVVITITNQAQDVKLETLEYYNTVEMMASIYEDLKRVQGKRYSIIITINLGNEFTRMTYDSYDVNDVRKVIGYLNDAILRGAVFQEVKQ